MSGTENPGGSSSLDIRQLFFKIRSYTPIPFIAVIVIFAHPTHLSLLMGSIFMITGELIRIISIRYLGMTTRSRNVQAAELVTTGLYACTRNPIYIGNMLLFIGFAVGAAIWTPWFPVLVFLIFAFQYSLIISLEEEFLISKFGETYENFRNNVHCWIPNIMSWSGDREKQIEFRKIIRSERDTLLAITGMFLILSLKQFF